MSINTEKAENISSQSEKNPIVEDEKGNSVSKFKFFKEDLFSRIGSLPYNIWFSDLEIRPRNEGIFFHTHSELRQEKITERYWPLLKELTEKHFPGSAINWDVPRKKKESFDDSDLKENPINDSSNLSKRETVTEKTNFSPIPRSILPENNWDNFLEMSENKLACHFISQAMERPGVISPIYLYGSVGVGKTHLLHAYAQSYREKVNFARVEYFTPDDFVSDFTQSLKTKTDRNFRTYYRSLDALLIDDIQFFMGKEKSSQEFFHVFNAIHTSGKQMIFTSDRDPRELDQLDDRLKSRISSSAIIEIKSPGLEGRKALINFYTNKEGLKITSEIRDFLANRLPPDIRQLVGAIRYLTALSSLEPSPLTIDYCQQHLKQLHLLRPKKNYPPEKILYAVCNQFGFTIKDLKARKKSKQISHCRQIAMYLLKNNTDLSLPEIGFALGGRKVSTVSYGIEKTERELAGVQGDILKNELGILLDHAASTSVF